MRSDAFCPFRSLVSGGFYSWKQVEQPERFIRTARLHDYLEIDGEPIASQEAEQEWTEEEIAAGRRNVATAFLPVLDEYEQIVHLDRGPFPELDIALPAPLLTLAAKFAGTSRVGDAYFRAHLRYVQKLALVVKLGGSVLAGGDVGSALVRIGTDMPEALLRNWTET